MNRGKTERCLKIGLFGAMLTLIGDCLIGAAKFPDGANMIDGYFAIALAMPAWRPILGGLIGFVGICLEFPGLMTIYPLIREKMPRGGRFYQLAMYVYLALGGNECMERNYKALCRDYKHDAKVLIKPVGGVKKKLGSPDLVIFFTSCMSHKMLQGAMGELLPLALVLLAAVNLV